MMNYLTNLFINTIVIYILHTISEKLARLIQQLTKEIKHIKKFKKQNNLKNFILFWSTVGRIWN